MWAVLFVLIPWPWVLADEDCAREHRFRDCRLVDEDELVAPQAPYYRPAIPSPPPLIELARDRRIEIIAAADSIR
jgi:hypothetical protein